MRLNRRNFFKLVAGTGLGIAGMTGISSAEDEVSGGEEIWSFETGSIVKSSPTVVDETVYVGSSDNKLYALDTSDGSKKWSFKIGDGADSAPTVVNKTVYFGGEDNKLYALNKSDGTKKWEFEAGGPIYSSPTVVEVSKTEEGSEQQSEDTVFFGCNDGKVYAVDAENGKKKWSFKTGDKVTSSPVVVKVPDKDSETKTERSLVYFGSWDGKIYALDASDGTEKWNFETNDRIVDSPTAVGISKSSSKTESRDGMIYIGSLDGVMYALDASDGTEKWSVQTDGEVYTCPTVVNGTVYFGTDENILYDLEASNSLYALDASDGTIKWTFETDKFIHSSPTVVYSSEKKDEDKSKQNIEGTVYFGCNDGKVYAVDADDGKKKWSFKTGRMIISSPTVADGTVYIGSEDFKVYAIRTDVSDSSNGSRVDLGTLGHHDSWDGGPVSLSDINQIEMESQSLPGFGVSAAFAGVVGGAYKYLSRSN